MLHAPSKPSNGECRRVVHVDHINQHINRTTTRESDMKYHPDRIARRTHSLRRQATHVHPVVADAFRRRACELELENWILGTLTLR